MSYDEDRLAEVLRQALQDEAEHVSPAGDGLGRIRTRIADQRFRRGRWLRSPALVLSAAAVAGIAVGSVIVVAAQRGDQPNEARPAASSTPADRTSPTPTDTPSATSSPQQSPGGASAPPRTGPAGPPADAAGSMPVTVYYLGPVGTGQNLGLYRERHLAPHTTGVIRAALNAMFADTPQDPDYRSAWPAGLQVRGVSPAGDSYVVDLPRAATARTASEAETRMSVQQLVYTVTEAARKPAAGVRLRIEGREISALWGQPLGNQPLRRAAQADVLAPVWITSPGNAATVGRTFTLRGEASVFEANVSWEIRSANGTGIRSGFATATAGGPARGTWSVPVTLPRGRYELRAFESSAQDGTPLSTDTKTIVVR